MRRPLRRDEAVSSASGLYGGVSILVVANVSLCLPGAWIRCSIEIRQRSQSAGNRTYSAIYAGHRDAAAAERGCTHPQPPVLTNGTTHMVRSPPLATGTKQTSKSAIDRELNTLAIFDFE